MELTPEVISQCEFCDHSIECRKLNPNDCEAFAFTISSNFNSDENEVNIRPYIRNENPEPYDFMTC